MMIATNPREMDAKNAYFADSIELKMAVPIMFIPAKRNPMKYNLKPFSAQEAEGMNDMTENEMEFRVEKDSIGTKDVPESVQVRKDLCG